jgi:hypothetical protein
MIPLALGAGALKLSVSTDKSTYGQGEPVVVTVTVMNAGSTPVALPDLSEEAHLTVNLTHSSGISLVARATGKAGAAVQTLGPGESVQVTRVFNQDAGGFRNSTNPNLRVAGRIYPTASLKGGPVEASSEDSGSRPAFIVSAATCADMAAIKSALGKPKAIGPNGPEQDRAVNIRDLAAMAQQLPKGMQCK